MKWLYYVDMVWVPIAAIVLVWLHLFYFGFHQSLVWFFIGGVIFWTFMEYAVHLTLHGISELGHIRHHACPTDRGGPGIFQTILVLSLAYGVFQLTGGFEFASSFYSGFLIGYATFLYIHNGIHWTKLLPESGIRVRHENHHAGDGRDYYGVTTRVWDLIFRRTYFKNYVSRR